MDRKLIQMIIQEEVRGVAKWGSTDRSPSILLNAATEELGEVAHAINHDEGKESIAQEIAETIGVLSRLYDMVIPVDMVSPGGMIEEINASNYQPIPKEMKNDLLELSGELSRAIKSAFGECQVWYLSNRIWRTIDVIPVKQ